jgi:hypothetical protein
MRTLATLPTVGLRNARNTQVRHYGTDPQCNHGGDETYIQNLRRDMSARYIFSLEGVHRMRRTLDPDYQPL